MALSGEEGEGLGDSFPT